MRKMNTKRPSTTPTATSGGSSDEELQQKDTADTSRNSLGSVGFNDGGGVIDGAPLQHASLTRMYKLI